MVSKLALELYLCTWTRRYGDYEYTIICIVHTRTYLVAVYGEWPQMPNKAPKAYCTHKRTINKKWQIPCAMYSYEHVCSYRFCHVYFTVHLIQSTHTILWTVNLQLREKRPVWHTTTASIQSTSMYTFRLFAEIKK